MHRNIQLRELTKVFFIIVYNIDEYMFYCLKILLTHPYSNCYGAHSFLLASVTLNDQVVNFHDDSPAKNYYLLPIIQECYVREFLVGGLDWFSFCCCFGENLVKCFCNPKCFTAFPFISVLKGSVLEIRFYQRMSVQNHLAANRYCS